MRLCLILLAWLPVPGILTAAEKVRPPYVALTGTYQRATAGKETHGYCNGCVVFDDGKPLACFGIEQRPGQPTRYTYLLLFRNGPEPLATLALHGKFSSSANRADERLEISLGKKVVKVAYRFETEEKTREIRNEALTIGDVEVRKDTPRVFLVDLTKEPAALTPVQVALPVPVPELAAEFRTWPPVLQKAVKSLQEKSPEIRKFLERPAATPEP